MGSGRVGEPSPVVDFPSTRSSALLGALSPDVEVRRASWERLARAYQRPIYKHLRQRFHLTPDDAADTTQAFLERCLEGGVLDRFEPGRARFRTYLRLRLDRFVQDELRAAKAQKRAAAAPPADFTELEGELAQAGADTDPEAAFELEWTRSVLSLALDALRTFTTAQGKELHFTAFSRFHTGEREVSYAELSKELDVDEVTLTHRLTFARRHYRRLVHELLLELCASDEEARGEATRILGDGSRRD